LRFASNERKRRFYDQRMEALRVLDFFFFAREEGLSEDVRLLHLVMNWRPSLTNSRGISRNSFAWSIVRDVFVCCVCGLWGVCVLVFLVWSWRAGRWYKIVLWCGGVCSECSNGGGRIEDGRGACRTHYLLARQLASGVGESCGTQGPIFEVWTTFFTQLCLDHLRFIT